MAQPVWITEPGHLGTVEEGKYFQIPLYGYDPDYPDDKSKIYYIMLAGELPDGVRCEASGIIEGIPKAVSSLSGTPAEVGENVTSRFTVRIYNERVINGIEVIDQVNDRTFTLTVSGQDVPEFITPSGLLGSYYDGSYVSHQIEFTDPDPYDTVTCSLLNGSLPPGLTLSQAGLISGYIDPIQSLDSGAIAGWDGTSTSFDEYPWDFATRTVNKTYQFAIKISDGKDINVRSFSIYVYSKDSFTADSNEFTVDNTFITVDVTNIRKPYINNYTENLGSYRHDNFFAYQYDGQDPDGDRVRFTLLGGSLPAGLHLDEETGWMFGYIPDISDQTITYNWTIRIEKRDDGSQYRDFPFTMGVYGGIDTNVTWVTESDLGTINNGEVSTLNVEAAHTQGVALSYRLKSGSASKLPQGLNLQPSGNIIGRTSYETFSIDLGTTTFDKDIRTRLEANETTFDKEFTFTVEAFNVDEIVNVSKTFTVTLVRTYDEPCQCLRVEALPPLNDRELIKQLTYNTDIFKNEWIYRPDDPWFGVQQKVHYNHAYSLKAANFSEYIAAMETHHYWKRLTLGEIKTARALDGNGNVIYEVVYSQIVDRLVNNNGVSVSPSIKLKYPVNANDSTEIDTVYPNSLDNMRNTIVDAIGKVSDILPAWMLSKQTNGTVLGFTPAWVIAYTVPGKSDQIAYLINQTFGTQLNKVDFTVDRYIVDGWASKNWDVDNQQWHESRQTTFDRNLTITADTTQYTADETVFPTADNAVSAVVSGTIFDGNSTRFISSIDIHEYTDKYDKYILFPQKRIIEHGE